MLGHSLDVALYPFSNIFDRNAFFVSHQEQDIDPMMIGDPLKVSLHLSTSLCFSHTCIV